ncbi:MAG: DNA alkylation repair protein [Sulfuricellaceae bacterium]|nr:DNA alkylation repair protein [Sulfuricellaceae bacterium]
MTLDELRAQVRALGRPETARVLQGFFKTGAGQYGEGDVFLGIKAPVLRKLAKSAQGLDMPATLTLLASSFHEERLLALLLLMQRFTGGDEDPRQAVYQAYLDNTACINNWDLVDISAPHIVGAYLQDKERSKLQALVLSSSLWERRIAMVSCLHFIRHGDFNDTLQLAAQLLYDREDLMHKAAGWMLREVGKRDQARLEGFLDEHGRAMPRTMLRYAIERFSPELRQAYLRVKFQN